MTVEVNKKHDVKFTFNILSAKSTFATMQPDLIFECNYTV